MKIQKNIKPFTSNIGKVTAKKPEVTLGDSDGFVKNTMDAPLEADMLKDMKASCTDASIPALMLTGMLAIPAVCLFHFGPVAGIAGLVGAIALGGALSGEKMTDDY